jgi:hypothetical protein
MQMSAYGPLRTFVDSAANGSKAARGGLDLDTHATTQKRDDDNETQRIRVPH